MIWIAWIFHLIMDGKTADELKWSEARRLSGKKGRWKNDKKKYEMKYHRWLYSKCIALHLNFDLGWSVCYQYFDLISFVSFQQFFLFSHLGLAVRGIV